MNYNGRNMKDAHKDFALNDKHFNAICNHLESTLKDFKVPSDLIDKVKAIVETTRKDIVNC